MRFTHDLMAGNVLSIPCRMPSIDWPPVHFCQQDMCDRPQNTFWRSFEQIRKPHQQPALAETDRVVYIREGKEVDFHLGNGIPETQFAISFLEKFEQPFTHGEPRLSGQRELSLELGCTQFARKKRSEPSSPVSS